MRIQASTARHARQIPRWRRRRNDCAASMRTSRAPAPARVRAGAGARARAAVAARPKRTSTPDRGQRFSAAVGPTTPSTNTNQCVWRWVSREMPRLQTLPGHRRCAPDVSQHRLGHRRPARGLTLAFLSSAKHPRAKLGGFACSESSADPCPRLLTGSPRPAAVGPSVTRICGLCGSGLIQQIERVALTRSPLLSSRGGQRDEGKRGRGARGCDSRDSPSTRRCLYALQQCHNALQRSWPRPHKHRRPPRISWAASFLPSWLGSLSRGYLDGGLGVVGSGGGAGAFADWAVIPTRFGACVLPRRAWSRPGLSPLATARTRPTPILELPGVPPMEFTARASAGPGLC